MLLGKTVDRFFPEIRMISATVLSLCGSNGKVWVSLARQELWRFHYRAVSYPFTIFMRKLKLIPFFYAGCTSSTVYTLWLLPSQGPFIFCSVFSLQVHLFVYFSLTVTLCVKDFEAGEWVYRNWMIEGWIWFEFFLDSGMLLPLTSSLTQCWSRTYRS
jgi:hypothetical protein